MEAQTQTPQTPQTPPAQVPPAQAPPAQAPVQQPQQSTQQQLKPDNQPVDTEPTASPGTGKFQPVTDFEGNKTANVNRIVMAMVVILLIVANVSIASLVAFLSIDTNSEVSSTDLDVESVNTNNYAVAKGQYELRTNGDPFNVPEPGEVVDPFRLDNERPSEIIEE